MTSCVWNLRVFPEDARGCHCPFIWCLPHRVAFKEVSSIRFISRADREIGGIRHVAPPTWFVSNFLVRPASS